MMSPCKRLAGVSTLACLLCWAGVSRAQVFEVRNQSPSTVNIVICYHAPQINSLNGGFLLTPIPAAWHVKGWWVVRPNQTVRIASGNGRDVYVRMTKKDGTPIRPSRPRGEPRPLPVENGKAFELTLPQRNPGPRFVDGEGFYPYPANFVFTIRR